VTRSLTAVARRSRSVVLLNGQARVGVLDDWAACFETTHQNTTPVWTRMNNIVKAMNMTARTYTAHVTGPGGSDSG
jgi:hypothetical protein